jgi:hypothetical protein
MIGQTEHVQEQKIFKFFCGKSLKRFFACLVVPAEELSELLERTKPERGVIKAGNSTQVNATGFNQEYFRAVTNHIGQFAFNRGVPSSMHYKRTFTAKQSGCINQFSQFRWYLGRTVLLFD